MSTAPDSPKASKLGSLGSSFWLVLLALSVILFGANTGVATYEGSRLSGAGTGAADLQVLSQQLANQGREAVEGNAEAFKSFKDTKSRIESTVTTLRSRFGNEGAVTGALTRLEATWAPLAKSAAQLESSEPAVLALAGNANRFGNQVPQLQAQLNEVVRAMSDSGAQSSQI
ncbi:MAG: methyl-accepting chemotaxis protein, partial [Pseudoxanthomonas sp.]